VVEDSKLREDIESILVREDSSQSLRAFLPRLGDGWLSFMLVSRLVVVVIWCLEGG
jgi:hypothetical protein